MFKMSLLEDILARTVPSSENPLEIEDIQIILKATQKCNQRKEAAETWEKLLTTIWRKLSASYGILESQLLCSTCFYAVLQLCEDPRESYAKIYLILENSNMRHLNEAHVISLIYGMFQSSFFASVPVQYDPILDSIVIKSLEILLAKGYEYSRFTLITFKILGRLKKLHKSNLKKHVLDKNIQLQIFNLCNHNWENPITGVRDSSRIIFRTILSIVDATTYKTILNDINGCIDEENNWREGYYWNKAKYLMLTELIEVKATPKLIIDNKSWIDGIIYSLSKPGLVSAGTDTYFAILKKINVDEWRQIFTKQLLTALENNSDKLVENFGNYWCLATLKKMPELFDHLMSVSRSYCKYFVLKQGNKVGLVKKNWLSDDPYVFLIVNGLDSANLYVRLLSFEVLCLSHITAPPTEVECKLVVRFIENNINTDSTVLRINMIMSLRPFLNRLHKTFTSYHKTENDESLELLLRFCKEIQQLVIDSLNIPGNYQRKITSLKLCNVIFTQFTELPRKMDTWNNRTILSNVLNEKNAWEFNSSDLVETMIYLLKDDSDDIREHVNKILIRHYFDYIQRTDVFNRLITSGLDCIKSKFFYKIYCGINIFKILINVLMHKDRNDAQFNKVEDIFLFAFDVLKSIDSSDDNIVKTIESGKQLHAFVAIMSSVINHSLRKNYQLEYLKPAIIDDILVIMESQSIKFASQKEESDNSDFCTIDGIIKETIIKSGYEEMEKVEDNIKISDLSQIVLNTMWLNVKECCVLATTLICYLSQADQVERCRRCLNVLTNVLETSRHKGAMEAAGLALAQAIQYLTSLTQGPLSALPKDLLETKLEELMSSTMRTASVTRRGAGLAILVHQIVSSDSMEGKPLFHFFMRKLLSSCSTLSDPPSPHKACDRDLPKAIQIHFLTRIVTDRSLACVVMHYSAELAELAFVNLTSLHWQIRNAALQLYGALIPKLIGQNKQSGTEDTTVVTVAVDEFRTHFPQLWRYILQRVNVDNEPDLVKAHSDLVPLLSLLANCAKRYHFSFDTTSELTHPQVFNNLCKLLSSPITTLRKLTAKCICNNYPFNYINKNLMKREVLNENDLHGRLLVFEILYLCYSKMYRIEFEVLRSYYLNLFKGNPHSYPCKIIMENICDLSASEDLHTASRELNRNHLCPGAYYWIGIRIAQSFDSTPVDSWPGLCRIILKSNISERYLQVILQSIGTKEIGMETKTRICNLMLKYAIERDNGVAWKYVYKLSSKVAIALPLEFNIDCDIYNSATSYALPVVVKALIAANRGQELVQTVLKIFEFSDFDSADCAMRYAAMLANNELGLILPKKQLPDVTTAKVIFCAIIFLQEEDDEIRYDSINFYNNITGEHLMLNPYICLKNIFRRNFLMKLFKEPSKGVLMLCDEVDCFVKKYENKSQSEVDINPFHIVTNNIYIELERLQNLANNLRLEI